mgnify:CR=1 FL=1
MRFWRAHGLGNRPLVFSRERGQQIRLAEEALAFPDLFVRDRNSSFHHGDWKQNRHQLAFVLPRAAPPKKRPSGRIV